MIDPRLLFELIQSELRERWQQSGYLRLRRAATTQRPKLHQHVRVVVSGLLIAAGQRIQAGPHSNPCWSQACCVLCTC